jgi:hypothetical protein
MENFIFNFDIAIKDFFLIQERCVVALMTESSKLFFVFIFVCFFSFYFLKVVLNSLNQIVQHIQSHPCRMKEHEQHH